MISFQVKTNIRSLALLALLSAVVTVEVCGSAVASTYYVSPSGQPKLSQLPNAPGSLSFAIGGTGGGVSAAKKGDTVILEDGAYDCGQSGYTVYNSGVVFQAKSWHGAHITNSAGSALINPANNDVSDVTWQGVVFGPSTGLGWSGGGAGKWKYLDCVFDATGGIGSESGSVFQRDVFSDASSNAFDIGGDQTHPNHDVLFKDCIVRRSNRSSGDDDSVGNKEFFTRNITFDDIVAYDNNGATLWFDTDNDDFLIENSTFFGNHGGADWYYCGVGTGVSATQFTGFGQDGEQINVGQPVKCIAGTPANIGKESVVTAVSGSGPQTITISPALPATPGSRDQFIVMQLRSASGDGFITEANDDGVFSNNVLYGNTDHGYFDHSSGGKLYGGAGGMTITGNLFAYNGESIFVWSDQRDTGGATIEHNQFKFDPGKNSPFDSWGSTPGLYPCRGGITFDYNTYDADNAKGSWVAWFGKSPPETAGAVTAAAATTGQDYFQNPQTWNQDQHGSAGVVPFWGIAPKTYIWPDGKDTSWVDVLDPNNAFGLANSIHQIDDTDGAVTNTIESAMAGRKSGATIVLSVSAHTAINGGVCEAYDLAGRWITLTVPPALQSELESRVPPYVTCGAGNKTVTYHIRVKLTSVETYNIAATLLKG